MTGSKTEICFFWCWFSDHAVCFPLDSAAAYMFLMFFLYKTGARIQELLDIKLGDIQFGKSPAVTLFGKGSKARSVPLRENTAKHLNEHVRMFHPDGDCHQTQHLFYTVRNGLDMQI